MMDMKVLCDEMKYIHMFSKWKMKLSCLRVMHVLCDEMIYILYYII